METERQFNVKVEYCVRSGCKEDYEIIKVAIQNKWPKATVEGVGEGTGTLEVTVYVLEKEPQRVYSMLEHGDPRVNKENVQEVIARIEKVL